MFVVEYVCPGNRNKYYLVCLRFYGSRLKPRGTFQSKYGARFRKDDALLVVSYLRQFGVSAKAVKFDLHRERM